MKNGCICRFCALKILQKTHNYAETSLKSSGQNPDDDEIAVLLFRCRMNQAPTAGFEEDVGARTTHHVMYPESAIDLDNTTSLVLIPFKTLDLQWIVSALTTGAIKQYV